MAIACMDAERIVGYFRGKSILITGSTGFLGQILVEKILRVQPDANKLYLLVRGTEASSAASDWHRAVRPAEGEARRRVPAVDPRQSCCSARRHHLREPGAAGGSRCSCRSPRVTYVCGDREGLILEKPIESLREGTYLNVDAELQLVKEAKKNLTTMNTSSDGDDAAHSNKKTAERKAMKELGLQRARHFGWSNTYVFTKAMGEMVLGQLRGDMPVVVMRPSIITSVRADPLPGWMQGIRTIDTLIIGYAKQNLSCFLGDLSVVVDVIPGDMAVNAMMAAMVEHSEEKGGAAAVVPVYHATSSLRNPATYSVLYEAGRRHFYENPRVGKNGEIIPTREMCFFSSIARFHLYMLLTFKLPLEILHLVNLLLCGHFSRLYNDLNRKYKFVMHLVHVYGPFAFFNGRFDDMNLERLRLKMAMKTPEDHMFIFDPKTIDWDDYFTKIHIPGVLKYLCK
ncbi:hypothetical protein PVAP13_6KG407800 [Panicum virgatum]|uniref:Fatty acyl-CoA reductase n=1 Tax=Panicum virgatum TaxID=38727 RepID=A0A8T0RI66_PANVG|nr:hypothetical protein PVAP13_6KG407800 [Panicum virgatum]KAG2585717.1 hypothetical protein PVAP13_6KG407800 [Panicum virgatum]